MQLGNYFDVVVIGSGSGSGFGGSVVALRSAEAGNGTLVLECGKAYPPGSFPRGPREFQQAFWDPSAGLHSMYNFWSFPEIDVLVASGLGGGSLLYANVLLRMAPEDLAGWPLSYSDLEPHYAEAERIIGVQRYPFAASTPKSLAFADAAQACGRAVANPPLAVSFDAVPGKPIAEATPNLHGRPRYACRLCGECDVGCNYGSKNTMDLSLLSSAQALGAEIRTLSRALEIRPERGGYRVEYVQYAPAAAARARDLPRHSVWCKQLVLAAGALGSTYLLLANRANLPGLSPALGRNFCGNGDLIGFVRAHRKIFRRRLDR